MPCKAFESNACEGMLSLPESFLVLENNPISMWDFKRESFAKIGVVTVRLFGLARTEEEGIARG